VESKNAAGLELAKLSTLVAQRSVCKDPPTLLCAAWHSLRSDAMSQA